MYQDPKIEFPAPVKVFSPKLKPLWLEALARGEVDLKRQAAQTIAMAHELGVPDLEDTAGPLSKTLDGADPHPVVSLAAAKALVALDARQCAPLLFEHAMAGGPDMAQLVEPTLARWDHGPIRKVWLDRLSAPDTPRRLLVLAIRGVAVVGERKAESRLGELARSGEVPPEIRLEAARALGSLRTEGLVDDARRLAADKSSAALVDRLIAASLLRAHQGETTQRLLLELAVDPEPAVGAIALGRLLEIDPLLVVPVAERLIDRPDPKLRRFGAEALVSGATPESVAVLGPMLDDRHPGVRRYVCESLLELASQPALRASVLEQATEQLAADRWRGIEQAALLLTALDHKPTAGRLVELLDFQRPEVFVTAAWGLRKLAVPDTLGAMFDKARRQHEKAQPPGGLRPDEVRQVCQLFEALGLMKHVPSASLMRQYIPKSVPYASDTRVAAVWALGHLYAGQPQPGLVKSLSGRLADVDSMVPEDEAVRRMAATTLGRMKAPDALAVLRKFAEYDTINSEVGYACSWAIHQITGEPIPEPDAPMTSRMGWFLDPID
ncbi:MAG: HEAT repeat domain-containing protein [Planctomycetota bacterium]